MTGRRHGEAPFFKGGLAEPPPAFIHPSIVGGRPSVQVGSSRPLEGQGMWPGSPEHGLLRHGGGRMPPSIHFSQPSRQIPARPLGWPVPRGPGFIHPSIRFRVWMDEGAGLVGVAVTLWQRCPRSSLGRKLRSKTR